jgi:hypothetical protein
MSANAPDPARRPRRRTRRTVAAARALVERAEQRAKTCGGHPWEYISQGAYEALRRAVRGEEV